MDQALTALRYQGHIENWNDDRGFGFVTPNGGGTRAFVHIKAFANRRRRPANGDGIIYELAQDSSNRLRAISIRYKPDPTMTRKRTAVRQSVRPSLGGLVGLGFVVVLFVLFVRGQVPTAVVLSYVCLSVVAFFAYAVDKSAATRNRWRTKESTLLTLGLLGGWPGALLGQTVFRHKTKKTEFQIVFWVSVVINCGAFAWLLTDEGANYIHTLAG